MAENQPLPAHPRPLDGWVPVLVRVDDYIQVTELVAQLEAARVAGAPVDSMGASAGWLSDEGPDVRLTSWPTWPVDALRRLSESDSVTARRWTKAMDAIAVAEADWFTTSEVADLSGMTVNEWRDAPRKISRHLKAHYRDVPTTDKGDLAWPLRPWSNPDSPGEVSWGMPPDTKALWINLRGLER